MRSMRGIVLQWGCGTQCHEKGSCKVWSVSVVVTAQVSGNPGVSVQECTKSEGTSTRHDTISVLRCGYETRYEWIGERCDEGGNEAASSGGADGCLTRAASRSNWFSRTHENYAIKATVLQNRRCRTSCLSCQWLM